MKLSIAAVSAVSLLLAAGLAPMLSAAAVSMGTNPTPTSRLTADTAAIDSFMGHNSRDTDQR